MSRNLSFNETTNLHNLYHRIHYHIDKIHHRSSSQALGHRSTYHTRSYPVHCTAALLQIVCSWSQGPEDWCDYHSTGTDHQSIYLQNLVCQNIDIPHIQDDLTKINYVISSKTQTKMNFLFIKLSLILS